MINLGPKNVLIILGCIALLLFGFTIGIRGLSNDTLCGDTVMSERDHCLHYGNPKMDIGNGMQRHIPASSSEDTSKALTYTEQIAHNRNTARIALIASTLGTLAVLVAAYRVLSEWLDHRRKA